MKAKEYLFRIADLVGTNLGFDFFDWDRLMGEIEHLDYLDEHTLDMIQSQIVQATSLHMESGLTIEQLPSQEIMQEVINYLGFLTIKEPPTKCVGSREILEQNFSAKQAEWGRDIHLLLTIILIFDKSGNHKLGNSVYMLADFAIRVLKERRDKDVT